MTAEVAILNQNALVLAADSATTVRYWVKGVRQTRYFKGANKLFQLSDIHPVGLMIYSAASLHEVPWEILIKEFRAKHGADGSDHLASYAQRFFEFVKGLDSVFSTELKTESFLEHALTAALRYKRAIAHADEFKEADVERREELFGRGLDDAIAGVTAMPATAPFTEADVDAYVAGFMERVVEKLNSESAALELPSAALVPKLAELSIRSLVKRYEDYLPDTGVVIGGFGELEFFPSIEVFVCYGFLGDRFIANRNDHSRAVSRDKGAFIEPFATTSMINTFRMGISPDVFGSVREATKSKLSELAVEIAARTGTAVPDSDLAELVDRFVEDHQKEWFYPSLNNHYDPLARVVGLLPVTEMAALAKSLIELQSLKERVTESSESVSGPIDVAVISKHDGFVWIERKHYFRPELNPRFFARQRGN